MSADPPSNAPFLLEFTAGNRAGDRVELSSDAECIVGRAADADIVLDHKKASRRHARIFPQRNGFAIEDLGSINGTLVNGEKISQQDLFPGDSIQIADARIRVRLVGAQPGINEDLEDRPKTVGIFADRDSSGDFATMGNAMSGRLDATSPRELLTVLHEANVSGVLSIHPTWGAGRVLFRNGSVIHARIDGSTDIGPDKALQRLVSAKNGSFEFSSEEPPPVEKTITQPLDELLQDIESFAPQLQRLERLMHSMDENLAVADNANEAGLNDQEQAITRLVRENGALSKLLDRFPGTDTEAAKTIADLIESGTLTTGR